MLAEADQQILRDLMSDAMEEIETQQLISPSNLQANGKSTLFLIKIYFKFHIYFLNLLHYAYNLYTYKYLMFY